MNPNPVTAADPQPQAPVPLAAPANARSEMQILREVLPYLRPFIGRIVFALALVVVGKVAGLAVPMVLKNLVDTLGVKTDPALLVLPVGLLLAYGASRVGMTFFTEVRQIVFARVMARVSRRITLQVFRHLHRNASQKP